jgi:hypothetical protein
MKRGRFLACFLVCVLVAAPRVLAHADIAGEWAIELSGGDVQNEADMKMYVKQDDSRLTGYLDWNASATSFPLKGTITDDRFVIVWSSRVNGVDTEITFKGTVSGDDINGTVDIPQRLQGVLYARRVGH